MSTNFLCLHRNSVEELFIGAGRYNSYNSTYGTLFLSTNGGTNWVEKNNGLNGSFVMCMAINSNDFIFAGTGSGVFR